MTDHVIVEARRDPKGSAQPAMHVIINGNNVTKTTRDIAIVLRDVCGGACDQAHINGTVYPVVWEDHRDTADGLIWRAETPGVQLMQKLRIESVTK